jgi:hypothetical protein
VQYDGSQSERNRRDDTNGHAIADIWRLERGQHRRPNSLVFPRRAYALDQSQLLLKDFRASPQRQGTKNHRNYRATNNPRDGRRTQHASSQTIG